MRPSPDPMSSKFFGLPCFNAVKILFTCSVVAGTYGKQYFRNAGATNGAQIILNPSPMPPFINVIGYNYY